MAKEGYYTIRVSDKDEQTIRNLCEHINVNPNARGAYAEAIRFALRHTVAHIEAERPKEEAMYVTDDWMDAKAEAARRGKPIWRHADGTYAVADAFEFDDVRDPDGWTQIEES